MLKRRPIVALWQDVLDGTSPEPTIAELKHLLIYRRHLVENLLYWRMPVDKLSGVDFWI